MKQTRYLFFILLLGSNLWAQVSEDRIKSKIDSAWDYLEYGRNVEKALRIADELERIDHNQGSFIALVNTYQLRGEAGFFGPSIDTSLYWYQKAYDYSNKNDDKNELAYCASSLGSIYSEKGDYLKAYEYYNIGLVIREARKDSSDIIFILLNIAWLNNRSDKHDLAMKDYLKCLSIAIAYKDSVTEASVYNGISILHKKQKNFDKAIEYANRSIKLSELTNDRFGVGVAQGNLALVYKSQGDFKKAYDVYPKIYEFYKEEGFSMGVMSCIANMAICSNRMGNYIQAIIEAKEGLDFLIRGHNGKKFTSIFQDL